MNMARAAFTIENVVRGTSRRQEMKIFSQSGTEIGQLEGGKGLSQVLTGSGGSRWILHPKATDEMRPFSLSVMEANGGGEEKGGKTVLTIRGGLFEHKGKYYTFSSVAAGVDPREFLVGKRYICRLDGFPFANIFDVDMGTIGRLRRYFRGIIVGELWGLGTEGHHVRLSDELSDIALLLTASSFVLWSTG